jgi:hypothetical protein
MRDPDFATCATSDGLLSRNEKGQQEFRHSFLIKSLIRMVAKASLSECSAVHYPRHS